MWHGGAGRGAPSAMPTERGCKHSPRGGEHQQPLLSTYLDHASRSDPALFNTHPSLPHGVAKIELFPDQETVFPGSFFFPFVCLFAKILQPNPGTKMKSLKTPKLFL